MTDNVLSYYTFAWYLSQAVAAVMDDHSVALFSYEHRVYPTFDPRFVSSTLLSSYTIGDVVLYDAGVSPSCCFVWSRGPHYPSRRTPLLLLL